MEQFTVTDKYKKKRTVRDWNKPTIWLCNQNPFDKEEVGIDYEWLRGNTVCIEVSERLYDIDVGEVGRHGDEVEEVHAVAAGEIVDPRTATQVARDEAEEDQRVYWEQQVYAEDLGPIIF